MKTHKLSDEQYLEYLFSKCTKQNNCFVWNGAKTKFGYPCITRNKKQWNAHRWIFIYLNNYVPEVVMHTCDNPECINPEHLVGGTYKINNLDAWSRGRRKPYDRGRLCPKGHDNWGIQSAGKNKGRVRYCKDCRKINDKQRYQRKMMGGNNA